MNRPITFSSVIITLVLTTLSSGHAGEVTLPNTFSAGTPAVAAEVNANFSAVKTAVDDNDGRMAALETALATMQSTLQTQADRITTLEGTVSSQAATITGLQGDLAAVQTSRVMALEPYLTVDETTDSRGPLVQLAGVNLQIVNGLGSTNTVNGLGNLIVGYDEGQTNESYIQCSDGKYDEQFYCENAGGTWGHSFKSGSHYLVLGAQNNYSQYGGLVAGFRNFSTRGFTSVTGGIGNSARGQYSSISGGADGIASGITSSVSGGSGGIASGDWSSVSGGRDNSVTAGFSSVSGGWENSATGASSSVSGGYRNSATNTSSSVSGGTRNTAGGKDSSVSGGYNRSVSTEDNWRAGDYFQDF